MKGGRQGFTLLEIVIVTLIIGLLAVIAIPSFVAARRSSQINRFANDLRILCDGLNQLTMKLGHYPPDGMPGEQPVGLADYTRRVDWTQPTVVGGLWDWDYLQFQYGGRAGLSVYRPSWTASDMAAIDEKIDDGNLTTGAFRKRTDGYIYVIEQ
jgi:prepilin-type N-terminal cleavage/methylation domain-containing protein